ncbi:MULTISPECIES: MFS transporter [unclassified Exiguobacterium]|uniref:MFS transporter n=1 Tax=unclassified Exiguobacterium TaxID=2644629 RepID=UPI001BECC050|nr:MFS transporter [Exiguobacterium sp.]MBQ6458450.1 MFS transporter [Exiguobacterium sp.]
MIERLFWESRGITIQEVVYLEMIYALIIVLFEVPTGVWADRTTRRRLIQAGVALEWLSFWILLYSFTFSGFFVAISCSAVGSVIRSGAENALLYESLQESHEASSFERVLGKLNAIGIMAAVTAAWSGSMLAQYLPLEWNYRLSILSLLMATVCSLFLVEPVHGEGEDRLTWRHLLKGFQFVWSHTSIRNVTIGFLAAVSAFNFIDEFWQLYARDVSIPIYWFGAISSILLLIQLPGQLFAGTLIRFASSEHWLNGFGWLMGGGFLLVGLFPSPIGIGVMGLLALLYGAMEPLYFGLLHHQVPSDIRATTESSVSMLWHFGILVLGLVFIVGTTVSLFLAFILIGLVVWFVHATAR